MSKKKNIDQLFQEKFKNFEELPSDDIWVAIEAKLDEKKKRRIIPFWWKLSGIAAVFLIGFLVSKSIYDVGNKTENPIVNQPNSSQSKETKTKDLNKKEVNTNGTIQPNNAVVNGKDKEQINQKTNTVFNKIKNVNSEKHAITNASEFDKNKNTLDRKNKLKENNYSSKSAISERQTSRHRSLKNKPNFVKDKKIESALEKSENEIVSNKNNDSQSIIQKDLNFNENKNQIVVKDNSKENKSKTLLNLDDLKGTTTIKSVIKETQKKENDTAAISVAANELEELLNEKESKLKKESKLNRWQLTSNVAPIFLGSASNGSPIDSTLSRNSKSYNTNVGFGVGVSYAVNKKLSVRTGLNKVNMSYNTNDISFFTGIQAKTLKNVRPTASSAMIHVESTVANREILPSETGLLPFETSITRESSGYLMQEMGYLEVPVEMTYNLIDKKFGVKIIGGFSTLLLQNNSITIVSQDRQTLLGEANNLNAIHFSTNLGLGLKYGFFKSFEFNVEPTVKYQMNTYTANAGNFKPYFIGIYSGISYKF